MRCRCRFPSSTQRSETKAVDGQENPFISVEVTKFYEVQKYATATRHAYSPLLVLASKKFWDQLSDDRTQDPARRRERGEDATSGRSRATWTPRPSQTLKGKGMVVTELSDQERTRMRDKLQPVIDKHRQTIGRDGQGDDCGSRAHSRRPSDAPAQLRTSACLFRTNHRMIPNMNPEASDAGGRSARLHVRSAAATRRSPPTLNGPSSLIVPSSPGGGTDVMTRTFTDVARKYISQPLVVTNKPGASGGIGMGEVQRAAPDGYKVSVLISELAIIPHLGMIKFTTNDFIPIARINADPGTITVRADAPWSTVEEFLAHARKNPGEVKMGNAGSGTIWHLAAAAVEDKTGVRSITSPSRARRRA